MTRPVVAQASRKSSSFAPASPTGSTGKNVAGKAEQPSSPTVRFSKTGAPPPEMTAWTRQYLERHAESGQTKGGGDGAARAAAVLQLVDAVAQLPDKSGFDINQAIKNGSLTPVAVRPVSRFQPAEAHELQKRHDDLRTGRAPSATPEIDRAVTTYANQTYWPHRENPFEARSSAGGAVSDLLIYIARGIEDKVAKDGRSIQPLNQFNGTTFGSRTEALHYLLFHTSFLICVPADEANRFKKMYNELASKGL